MTTLSTRKIRTVCGELARDTAEQLAAEVGTVTVTPFDTRAQALAAVSADRDLALALAGPAASSSAWPTGSPVCATPPILDLTEEAMLHLVDDLHRLGTATAAPRGA